MNPEPIFLEQDPTPGTRMVKFRGDILTVFLTLPRPEPGKAYLRTNIGHADRMRMETIREVQFNEPPLARDWFDIPMTLLDGFRFKISLPLCETGHFEAKAFFLPALTLDPVWPAGNNLSVNVEPADTVCANTIYNAFVRQFGPNIRGGFFTPEADADVLRLDRLGYAVIPPSGTFRDFISHLDFIIGELGCRFIQLLPIHPTPTTYRRMGRFGSPYAALSFTTVDPSLAKFDPKATPTEQFMELVDAIHARGAKLILDIAINHTGWAAILHQTHPEWLSRTENGRIEVPGAWGVQWEDLTKLDYSKKRLWEYMGQVFLTWCHRGVDGFRCDAGYMIPVMAWRYLVALVRDQFPATLFFLEGLGGKISVTRDLLNLANFNWAYSELFQNYDRHQIEGYLPDVFEISKSDGILVHYAETHDNNRLASRSTIWAKMRTALCALLSHQGGFAFANGVEWYATEKIEVHQARSLNWGGSPNQAAEISRLSCILRKHPAFFDDARLKMIHEGQGNCLVVSRFHPLTDKRLLIVANLDDHKSAYARWKRADASMKGDTLLDLLTGKKVRIRVREEWAELELTPGQVLCLSDDFDDHTLIESERKENLLEPERIVFQRLRAKVLDVWRHFYGDVDLGDLNVDAAVVEFRKDPEEFCRSLNPQKAESRIIPWIWPQDLKREVMLPPGHFLLVLAPAHFRVLIKRGMRVVAVEDSLPGPGGDRFALFTPLPVPWHHMPYILHLSVYLPEGAKRMEAPLLYLSRPEGASLKIILRHKDLDSNTPLYFLTTNGCGGMLRAPVEWGKLTSRYDALLAANLHPKRPSDRWILWSRCRGWIVFQDYSQEISATCMDSFRLEDPFKGVWRFKVPTGLGKHVTIRIALSMIDGQNQTRMVIIREQSVEGGGGLSDDEPVTLILRPDIESRSCHDVIKAFMGPENHWPQAVTPQAEGFLFQPDGHHVLSMKIFSGRYVHEPEWHYMVHRFQEAQRGQDPNSDLFSPGYFTAKIKGGQGVTLIGEAGPLTNKPDSGGETILRKNTEEKPSRDLKEKSLLGEMIRIMDHYIVERDQGKTVIAGYPWFLDWGRDSLIFSRGLIAAGMLDDARSILYQFGRFESQGTLPNMIGEQGPANRDTSDAPLWFAVACRDLVQAEKNSRFLKTVCGDRTVREILLSIAQAYIRGTPNGIQMDDETGLIFSPAHFTWMDTNYPAGTPRQGYPIEIQALWYAALSFLFQIVSSKEKKRFKDLARQVRTSVHRLFVLQEKGYLSDCLHGQPGKGADHAEQDDALRPNQLFSITLGLVQDLKTAAGILNACRELLVPGAIRSLADRTLERPLSVVYQGRLLNDPHHPYQGRYEGDEDTRRKPAYHNGTGWTWLFPSFCEAYVMVYPETGKAAAAAWLSSAMLLLNGGCVGHMPEIVDGDFPHAQRGCDAQAWGISEWIRVRVKLNEG
ncbi:MAG: glycogen debranching protein [Desulfobacterales bacterium CG07_land_8_20_14_0_80_52_14]|nr:MAG: glycogen debranching protein [Desulfobacterales bacterium CG07_land_8_20_14_0_80_52_14]